MTDTVATKKKKLREIKTKVLELRQKMMLSHSENQEIWGKIEKILQSVLDDFSDDIRAVSWVVVSSKKDSEFEVHAIHALYSFPREKESGN